MSTKQSRVTIEHVARLAGVSTTTVSNVLNDRVTAMGPATLERVLEAVRMLGYYPSNAARSLVSGRTATVGLVIREIATPLFFGAVSAIERVARDSSCSVLLCHASDVPEERDAIDLLLKQGVDGMIFLSTSEYRDDSHISAVAGRIPVVAINRSGTAGSFDRILWDNAGGIADAVAHLHGLGHVRIAHFRGPPDRRSTDERFQGYRDSLAACGLEFHRDLVFEADYTGNPAAWEDAARSMVSLPQRPTAVIASDDSVAAVVIRALQEDGLAVPYDCAVIGVDDQPFAAFLNPALTTVRLPIAEAGREAATILFRRIMGESEEAKPLMLPTRLVVRESCGSSTGPIGGRPSLRGVSRTGTSG